MFCGSCGKQIPDGSGFCPSCGAAAGSGAPRPAANAGASTGPSAAAAQRAKIEAQFKAGSEDAMKAFMVLLKDPVGGLAKSFSMFDPARAKIVGLMFGGVYAVAATVASIVLFNALMGIFMMAAGGGGIGAAGVSLGGPSFGMIIRFFLIAVIYFAALVVGCLLTRMIFKGAGDLSSDIYIGGACLLPAAACLLAACVLGYVSFYLVIAVYVFALCYTILMLYAGCLQIIKITEAKAALAVPVVLIIAGGIAGIVLRTLMTM